MFAIAAPRSKENLPCCLNRVKNEDFFIAPIEPHAVCKSGTSNSNYLVRCVTSGICLSRDIDDWHSAREKFDHILRFARCGKLDRFTSLLRGSKTSSIRLVSTGRGAHSAKLEALVSNGSSRSRKRDCTDRTRSIY
jgi:hypothetical protein